MNILGIYNSNIVDDIQLTDADGKDGLVLVLLR